MLYATIYHNHLGKNQFNILKAISNVYYKKHWLNIQIVIHMNLLCYFKENYCVLQPCKLLAVVSGYGFFPPQCHTTNNFGMFPKRNTLSYYVLYQC